EVPRWSPDARWLLTVGRDAQLRIWDTATGRQVGVRKFPESATLAATFSSDGNEVYVTDGTGELLTFDRKTLGQVGPSVTVGTGVTTMGARGDVVILLRLDG